MQLSSDPDLSVTEAIVSNFTADRVGKVTPHLYSQLTSDKCISVIVQKLDEIADEIEAQFGERVSSQAQVWLQQASFNSFLSIAKSLFKEGISWSRIVVLLMFTAKASCLAVAKGLDLAAGSLCRYAVDYIVLGGILKWIQVHGGWLSVLHENSFSSSLASLVAFGCLLAMSALVLFRKGPLT